MIGHKKSKNTDQNTLTDITTLNLEVNVFPLFAANGPWCSSAEGKAWKVLEKKTTWPRRRYWLYQREEYEVQPEAWEVLSLFIL